MAIDFSPIREAQLGPTDLAQLVGVSRVAASLWLNGHSAPIHLIHEKVARVVDEVQAAVNAGLLPVPHHVTRRERGHYIRTALTQAADTAQ